MEIKDKFSEVERTRIVQAAKRSLWGSEGKQALDYLLNVRGFTKETVKKFEMGYCPLNINHQLRGRLITPIYDEYKKLIAVSTRHLDKNNSHRFWHEAFNKSSYLYGLCYSKNEIIRKNKVILVEGEFDVASLHSNNYTMTVGVCGSALSLLQIAILAKYCSDFYLLFDGDEAGRRATKRALDMYKQYNLSSYLISFFSVSLPVNKDPNDFILEKGSKALMKLLVASKEDNEMLKMR